MIFPVIFNKNQSMLDLVFRITLYFGNAHTLEIRRGIVQAFGDYIELVGDRLTHHGLPGSRGWGKLSKQKTLERIAAYAEKASENTRFNIALVEQQGDTEYTPRCSARHSGVSAAEHKTGTYQSHVSFCFPLDFFASSGRPHPHHLIQRWAHILHADQGWGGVGFIWPQHQQGQRFSETLQYHIATIWPNILLELPSSNRRV